MPQQTGELAESTIQVTPCLNEWNYGKYEGLTLGDIARIRDQNGEGGKPWNIWKDGCPGGEYVLPSLLSPFVPFLGLFCSGVVWRV